MQKANVIVALGGDRGNTVPKYGVTASEIAVLMAIHGNDAVTDIQPLDDDETVNHREERNRLLGTYKGRNPEGHAYVEALFPGAAARLIDTLDELNLPDDLYKATERMTAAPKKAAPKKAALKKADPEPADTAPADTSDEENNVLE
jgi:hypothetical protein